MKQYSLQQTGLKNWKPLNLSTRSKAGLSPAGPASIEHLLSRKEVAQRWHCCPKTIARRKDLRPVRLTRRMIRYRLADIQAIEAAAVSQ
jgi:hypothetical protein